jgi:hypothetical protein
MKRIRRLVSCLATALLLLVLFGQAPDAAASARAGEVSDFIVLQSDSDSLVDRGWPVLHRETKEFTDPDTGVHHVLTTVIREKPQDGSGAAEESEACQEILGGTVSAEVEGPASLAAVAGCSFVRSTSRESTDILSYGGTRVEHHLKSFADLYYGPRGNYYKLKQIHIWWKRTSTRWTVKAATWAFGCPVTCEKCDYSDYKGKKTGTIGTPIWKDATTSSKYIITGDFPPLWNGLSCEIGGAPAAGSTSDGYYSGVKKGKMLPSVCWN